MNKIFQCLVVFALLYSSSCTTVTTKPVSTEKEVIAAEPWLANAYVYKGILPCPDCKGNVATLFTSTDGTKFKLDEKHTNGDTTLLSIAGHLNTERGFETDEDATVYILNDNFPAKEQRIFVRRTGSENLFPCTIDRKAISGFLLSKVK